MGLEHLTQIEEFLKKNKKDSYTRTDVRDELGFNYNVVLSVLAYLLKNGKIKKIKGPRERYQWK